MTTNTGGWQWPPTCPKCGTTIPPPHTTCPNCDQDKEKRRTDDDEPDSDEWVGGGLSIGYSDHFTYAVPSEVDGCAS